MSIVNYPSRAQIASKANHNLGKLGNHIIKLGTAAGHLIWWEEESHQLRGDQEVSDEGSEAAEEIFQPAAVSASYP